MKNLWADVCGIDKLIIMEVYSWRGKDFIDKIFCTISKSGDGPLYVLGFALLYLFNVAFAKPMLVAALIAFTIELPVYKILKKYIKRERPFEKITNIHFLIPPPDRFSFPSGHTAAAFLVWSIVSSFFPILYVPGLIWASLVGFSRVYLCVHYPSDILAGIIVGILSAQLGLWFV